MDPVINPYVPGAGTRPPELAGRDHILEAAQTSFARIARGRAVQSIILVGLRGVGKTVVLMRIGEAAEAEGMIVLHTEGCDDQRLAAQLTPGMRSALLSLSMVAAARDVARKSLGVLKAFAGGLGISIGDLSVNFDPSLGIADSGDIKADLPELFVEVGKAAKAAGRVVVLLVDELQVLEEDEFAALIMAIHRVNQLALPVAFVGAGLPQILAIAGNAKSYSERLFLYQDIGALTEEDAVAAIELPARLEEVEFEPEAVAEILRITKRYPYFIQQWAHEAWNIAEGEQITWRDVLDATDAATRVLDDSFFKVRFDRCTPGERTFMRGLAELGDGSKRMSDVAEALGAKPENLASARAGLIKKGMIFSPSYGDICFTVPLFDEFMKRVVPELPRR